MQRSSGRGYFRPPPPAAYVPCAAADAACRESSMRSVSGAGCSYDNAVPRAFAAFLAIRDNLNSQY